MLLFLYLLCRFVCFCLSDHVSKEKPFILVLPPPLILLHWVKKTTILYTGSSLFDVVGIIRYNSYPKDLFRPNQYIEIGLVFILNKAGETKDEVSTGIFFPIVIIFFLTTTRSCSQWRTSPPLFLNPVFSFFFFFSVHYECTLKPRKWNRPWSAHGIIIRRV